MRYYLRYIAAAGALLGCAAGSAAQSFDPVGTRAAGMAGAFVAVADDASAAYWNPAGFASGNFFSIVLDRTTSKSDPTLSEGARKTTGFLFAMGMPALGLSYYQIRSASVSNAAPGGLKAGTAGADEADEVRLATLVTHHTGATLLQSIGAGITVGTTLKLVRGVVSSTVVPDGPRDTLLAEATELGGKGSSRFDADIGVMKAGSLFKAGLTIRNVTNPEFAARDGSSVRVRRQARAGVALVPLEGWVVDADLDLTSTPDVFGPVRNFALGTEGRLWRKAFVRGGLRKNTRGSSETAVAAGASYMVVNSFLIDAQVTGGDARANRGWGVSARFVY
jgi:hypothetical protein